MKLSLRTEKLNSQNFKYRIDHNSRATNSKSYDSEKSKNNISRTSKHFQKTVAGFWDYVRADFDKKKSQNLIEEKKRFLKRNSTKSTKDRNGKKKSEQVETSIMREFVIQLGNEKDGFLSDEDSKKNYYKIQNFIAKEYKLTVLKSDLHFDETVPHLHIIATSYNFETGVFSKEFNKKNSYESMQKKVFEFCNDGEDGLGLELEGYEKKECLGADYIAPAVWKREKETIKKALEFCKDKDDLTKQLEELTAQLYHPTLRYEDGRQATYQDVANHYEKKLEDTEKQLSEEHQELSKAKETLKAQKTTIDAQTQEIERLSKLAAKVEQQEKELETLRAKNNAELQQQKRKEDNKTKQQPRSLEDELRAISLLDERSELDIDDVRAFAKEGRREEQKIANNYIEFVEEVETFERAIEQAKANGESFSSLRVDMKVSEQYRDFWKQALLDDTSFKGFLSYQVKEKAQEQEQRQIQEQPSILDLFEDEDENNAPSGGGAPGM